MTPVLRRMTNGTVAALLLLFVGVRVVVAPAAGAVYLLLAAIGVALVVALLSLRGDQT